MSAARLASETELRPVFERGTRLADRYQLLRLVGHGAMGVVYEALDESRAGLRVAIKLLIARQPHALYRLKNEFRALAETVHPNLVGLHGLGVDGANWFVVMDLIEPSTDFVAYARDTAAPGFHEARLRSALAQLVRGVAAIHAAGKLHRDLKPSNVLVTHEGRVVVVDFGLVGELEPGGVGRTLDSGFAGTPAYAAPEQALGRAMGPKTDLYAVGVMLFEVLTGRLPFDDATPLEGKLRRSAPAASSLVQDIPADLAGLCERLLQREPDLRPDAEQVLKELGEQPLMLEAPTTLPFVAREAELDALRAAALRTRQGAPVVVAISGPSGIGKSALIEHFVDVMFRQGSAVFRGRCHAQERLPYKAFDALVDALGRHLLRLSPLEAARLMPREMVLLSRLFPTLARVPAVQQMPPGLGPDADEGLLRPRAFAALKELLARVADRSPLILCVDDLQWADADSLELLREILRPPGAPACLLICAFREDELSESALSAALRSARAERIDLRLGPLDAAAGARLAGSLLGAAASERELQLVVGEAVGNPFLLKELARDARVRGAVAGLQATVAARIAQLDGGARDLLELVCLAGQPLELEVAARAAQAGPGALPAVLASLLVRTNLRRAREYLETHHDRIRDAVAAGIQPERRAHLHARLASEFARDARSDPELAARHYRAAGLVSEAHPYTLRAAERASHALAFGRAVELYELALAEAPDQANRRSLQLALADAYAAVGRLVEAAEHYERVLEQTTAPDERRRLSSKAMAMHLLTGDLERGAHLAGGLCTELGVMPLPRQRLLAALVQLLLFVRYVIGGRPSKQTVPAASRHTQQSRQRLDFCLRAASGFLGCSPDHSVYFALRAGLATRRYRDPTRWPIVLSWDVSWRGVFRGRSSDHDEHHAERAIALAERNGDAETLAIVLGSEGGRLLYIGRFRASAEAFERAEHAAVSTGGRSLIPIFGGTRSGRLAAWISQGDYNAVAEVGERWAEEAHALGDRFGELVVRVLSSCRFLALDAPDGAHESRRLLETELGQKTLFVADPGWVGGEAALYEGDIEGALAAYERARSSPLFGLVQRISSHRTWCSHFMARASLMAAARGLRGPHIAVAAREARRLRGEAFPAAAAVTAQVRGTLARLEGNQDTALAELERAAAAYAEAGVLSFAAAMRYRVAGLIQGDRGAELAAEATAAAASLGLCNPARWFQSLAPGFGD